MGNIPIAMGISVAAIAALLILNPYLSMVATLLISLLLAGTLEVFFYFGQGNWGASVAALSLIAGLIFSKPVALKLSRKNRLAWSRTLFFSGFAIYLSVIFISSILNLTSPTQLIAGLRNYLPFMGIFLVLALGRIAEPRIKTLLFMIIGVGCLQWLYVLAEVIIIGPKRAAAIDAVGGAVEVALGSFGGNVFTGGYTGEMASFVVMTLILCTILWQANVISKKIWLLSVVSAGVSVGLAETKIIFVLIPLMVITTLWRYPGGITKKTFNMVIMATVILALIAVIYDNRFWAVQHDFKHAFTYSFDPNFMIDKYHRGRIASILHWWQHSAINGPFIQALFGYGPGASLENSSIAGQGLAVQIYGVGLDNNAMSKLLWDFGIIGFMSFFLMIVGVFFEATRLINATWIPVWGKWTLVGFKAWLVAFIAMLPYQPSMVGAVPVQFIFWFTIGVIAYFGGWHSAPLPINNSSTQRK